MEDGSLLPRDAVTQDQFSKLQVLFVVTLWEMISILELGVDEGEQLILICPVEGLDVGKVDVIQV